MSHIQALNGAKQQCETTGQCSQYETLLHHENQKVDSYTSSNVQSTVTWGLVIGVIGIVVLLTPFFKPFNKFQRFFLPKLAIAAPVLVGLVGGAFAGFAITFSACFKQECSAVEGSAFFIIPLLTLIVTIPLARKIYRKRQTIAEVIGKPRPQIWVILGLIIIAAAVMFTSSGIAENKQKGEAQKQYLKDSKI